jgi:hypothetical protein
MLAWLAPPGWTAITGGVRVGTDTTGTNTTGVRVTVSAQTNLLAGAVVATNAVTVGRGGLQGVLNLVSTNGDVTITQSVEADGTWQVRHGSTNMLELALASGYGGTGVQFLSDDGTYRTVGTVTNTLVVSNFFATNIWATNVYVSNLYATNIYVTNLYVTNAYSESIYTSNFYTTNLYAEYAYISNVYATNIYVNEVTVTNTFNVKGNSYNSNLYTINLIVSNSISGTIDATEAGLTLIQRRSLKLQYPRRVDGAGCTYNNTNDFTAALFMVPRFSAAGATNANWAQWAFRVPADLDTSEAMTASLTVQLAGADTDAATYTVGVVSIANSSAGAGTPANYVTLTIPADGSGGSGDVESVSGVTLTGWAAALTANQWALVQLQRDGSDASAVAQDLLELELTYVSSQ